jgi:gluconate kinase
VCKSKKKKFLLESKEKEEKKVATCFAVKQRERKKLRKFNKKSSTQK